MTARKPAPSAFPTEPESGVRLKVVRLPVDYPEDTDRPRTFQDCERMRLGTKRKPCPFVSCKHHLYLDTSGSRIMLNWPGEIEEMPVTCSLRAARRGGMTLDAVGEAFCLTRERIRQVEAGALGKAGKALRRLGFDVPDDVAPDARVSKRATKVVRKPRRLDRIIHEAALAEPGIERVALIVRVTKETGRFRGTVHSLVVRMLQDGRLEQFEGRVWASGVES